MKKFTGNFTPNAGKVLKNSERIICRVDEDGTIYITNGYFAFKLSAYEYAAVIQPAVCCEAGNWTMNNGEKAEEPPARTWPRPSRTRSTRPPAWRRWSGAP